ncbi:MAG: hypothetical protein ABSE69_16375 [Roseiarcus sp.]
MAKKPIMTADEERFMAFEGLVQWVQASITQAARVSAAYNHQTSNEVMWKPAATRQAVLAFHSERHFLAIAAHKILEYRDWVLSFGLCASVDFGELNQFPAQDRRDLRNMREHVVGYFKGDGNSPVSNRFQQRPPFASNNDPLAATESGVRIARQSG